MIIATISGSCETERLVLALANDGEEGSSQGIELQRQTWSESLGWFTQSRVRVAKDEICGLRSALGIAPGRNARPVAGGLDESSAILQFPTQHSA